MLNPKIYIGDRNTAGDRNDHSKFNQYKQVELRVIKMKLYVILKHPRQQEKNIVKNVFETSYFIFVSIYHICFPCV